MSGSRGKVVVISGPSGSGKTTLLNRLLACAPVPLVVAVSATTRSPRPGERNGTDYYFMDQEEFDRRRERGEFLECFEVFGRGHWYGTLRDEVLPRLAQGKWVVLEIDVHGMQAVVREFPDAITIFVHPSNPSELERRLRGRGTENEAAIQRRLEEARRELACAERYQYQVYNDRLDEAVREIREILIQAQENDES